MKIANNVISLQVYNSLRQNNAKISTSMNRLSSGLKINRSKDDSAGYAVASKLQMQVSGLEKGSANATDGISLMQTADGALSSVHEILQRARELAVRAGTGSLEDSDRRKINREIEGLLEEVDEISKKTDFNGIRLINGGATRISEDLNRDVSKITNITEGIPEGTLSYDITNATNSVYASSYNGTQTAGVDGRITINGAEVDILATDSAQTISEKILQACDDSNLILQGSNFVSVEPGDVEITFEGNPTILANLGLSGGTNTTGKNATISNVVLTKVNGQVDTTYKPTVISNGNKVSLLSPNNNKIDIDANPSGNINTTATTTSTEGKITNGGQINLQLGGERANVLSINIPEVTRESLDIQYVNVSTLQGAEKAITTLNNAINEVSEARAKIGAYQNRLEFSIKSIDISVDSTKMSLSRIQDTDMAEEMTNYTKLDVINQAATAIMAQANQRPQSVLQLLG